MINASDFEDALLSDLLEGVDRESVAAPYVDRVIVWLAGLSLGQWEREAIEDQIATEAYAMMLEVLARMRANCDRLRERLAVLTPALRAPLRAALPDLAPRVLDPDYKAKGRGGWSLGRLRGALQPYDAFFWSQADAAWARAVWARSGKAQGLGELAAVMSATPPDFDPSARPIVSFGPRPHPSLWLGRSPPLSWDTRELPARLLFCDGGRAWIDQAAA